MTIDMTIDMTHENSEVSQKCPISKWGNKSLEILNWKKSEKGVKQIVNCKIMQNVSRICRIVKEFFLLACLFKVVIQKMLKRHLCEYWNDNKIVNWHPPGYIGAWLSVNTWRPNKNLHEWSSLNPKKSSNCLQ